MDFDVVRFDDPRLLIISLSQVEVSLDGTGVIASKLDRSLVSIWDHGVNQIVNGTHLLQVEHKVISLLGHLCLEGIKGWSKSKESSVFGRVEISLIFIRVGILVNGLKLKFCTIFHLCLSAERVLLKIEHELFIDHFGTFVLILIKNSQN